MTAALIRAAYRFDLTEREHLRELAQAGAAAFKTKGQVIAAAFHHVSDTQTETQVEVGSGDERIVRALEGGARMLTPSERALTMQLSAVYESCSNLFGASEAVAGFRKEGFGDLAGLMCLTDARAGIVIVGSHADPKPVRPNERKFYQPAALHVAAAWKLRRALAQGEAVAEAVLDADGRALHAEGALTTKSARTLLREAVQQRERCMAGPPSDDAPGFPALLAGTWMLADRFESDGRRHVVAYRVAKEADDELLSEAARYALTRAVEGVSNKVIALELGVSEPTVTRLITRAIEVLRLSDMREAIALARNEPAWLRDTDPELCCWQIEREVSARGGCLTAAERDVVRRLSNGATRSQVARDRGTSLSTVHSQLVSIYAKLNASNKRELMLRLEGDRA